MQLHHIPAGNSSLDEFNVIIEIAAQSDPVKYEMDKEWGILTVDRFVSTGMRYPANYGFIPQTLAGDGDPVDVLVITPYPLAPGALIRSRAVGLLNMTDESGADAKVIAVPVNKVCLRTAQIQSIDDIPDLRNQIKHFFSYYKALEPGKWVKVEGWLGAADAPGCD